MYSIFEQLLQERGITQYRVSKDTRISQATLIDWKNGKSIPKYDKMQKLAAYFGVSVDYLLGNEKKPIPQEDELIKDEFIAFYGEVKQDLDDDDIADLKTFIRMKSEIKRKLTEKK